MKEICDDCICVQFTDDFNIYKHWKQTISIEQNIVKLEKTLNEVYKWSKTKNLIFNPDKTKFMIFTTNKSKIRNTDFQFHPDNATTLTRTISTKILDVHFQQQLSWADHITELSKTCDATLSALRKMKTIAPFNIRKHLCESLVLSKLDYCGSVFDPLTIIQQRQLQKIQNSCDALVF